MSYIEIHQSRISDREAAKSLCPFGAISENAAGELEIGAGCRMCRVCIRRGGGAFGREMRAKGYGKFYSPKSAVYLKVGLLY